MYLFILIKVGPEEETRELPGVKQQIIHLLHI